MELNGTTTQAFWTGTSYLLANVIFQPFLAELSDLFGQRCMLLTSISFFTLGTALCSASRDFKMLLSGRSIQGLGGGGCFAMTHLILTDVIPLQNRPSSQNMLCIIWAILSILGPLIGEVIEHKLSWRWIFYLNFPFCALSFIMAAVGFKLKSALEDITFRKRLSSVDWIGGTMFAGSITSILVGLTWAGIDSPWLSIETLIPIGIGSFGVILTLIWLIKGAQKPFIPLYLFTSLGSNAAFFCVALQGLVVRFHTPSIQSKVTDQ